MLDEGTIRCYVRRAGVFRVNGKIRCAERVSQLFEGYLWNSVEHCIISALPHHYGWYFTFHTTLPGSTIFKLRRNVHNMHTPGNTEFFQIDQPAGRATFIDKFPTAIKYQ